MEGPHDIDAHAERNLPLAPESLASEVAREVSALRDEATRAPTYYGYSGSQRERPLRDYLMVVITYWYLIVIGSLVGLVAGVHFSKKLPTVYESIALVNIGSYIPALDGPTADALRHETQRIDYISNLMPFLSSYRLARDVIMSNKKIQDLFGYQPILRVESSPSYDLLANRDSKSPAELGADIPVSILDGYLSTLRSSQVDGTSLVTITANAAEAELAALLANEHAQAFIKLVREQRSLAALVNVDFLRKREGQIRKKVEETERSFIEFARTHNIIVNAQGTVMDAESQRFSALIDSIGQAGLERAQSQGELNEMRRSTSLENLQVDDRAWPVLEKIFENQSSIDSIKRYNRSHPAIHGLRRENEKLEGLIKLNAKQRMRETQLKKRSIEQRELSLRRELDSLRKDENANAATRLEYILLEREAKEAKEEFDQISKRLEDAEMNAESDQKTVTLVDPAMPPPGPLPVNRSSRVVSGFLFGMIFGIALAFFIDFQNTSIRSVSDLRDSVPVPVLGMIPLFHDEIDLKKSSHSLAKVEHSVEVLPPEYASRGKRIRFCEAMDRLARIDSSKSTDTDLALPEFSEDVVLLSAPHSKASESFRNVRTTLKYSGKQEPPRIIMVTSGRKGDGKTTTAVNIAVSLAQTGAKTLIIDGDMRLPRVHEYFYQPRQCSGLSDFLSGEREYGEDFVESGTDHLTLLLAGSLPPNPAELLSSRRMHVLMQSLKHDFEYIIVDTPPVGEIVDGLQLTRLVDGVVMVVRSGVTPKSMAQLAASRLKQVRANLLGTVLNGVKPIGSYGYAYAYGDGYLNPGEAKSG